jgi:hypothetical protein
MNMRNKQVSLILIGFLVFASLGDMEGQENLSFQSGKDRVQLLELFTSQGCSSCPPAEKWITQFVDHSGLWTEIVPVTFHVSYWDRLGWKNPFASKQYTQRQYEYSKNGGIRNVYTPCFVSNGEEWRGYFNRDSLPIDPSEAAILKGEIANGKLEVEYSDDKAGTLNVAILGFDLVTDVRNGENRGKHLEQQFVVLNHQTGISHSGIWTMKLPKIDITQAERFGLAIWVTKMDDLQPLQATGTWLEKSLLE